jgi:hypothetical protein
VLAWLFLTMIIVRESNQRIVWNFKIVNFCFKNYFPLRKGNQIPYFLAVLFCYWKLFFKVLADCFSPWFLCENQRNSWNLKNCKFGFKNYFPLRKGYHKYLTLWLCFLWLKIVSCHTSIVRDLINCYELSFLYFLYFHSKRKVYWRTTYNYGIST